MTCIVGLVHNGVTYIGADSLGSTPYTKAVRKDRKVFRLKNSDKVIIGATHSFRMTQLLMYSDELIDERDIKDDLINHEYMVTKFIPNVIDLFEKNGFSRIDQNEKVGGRFLVGYKDKLYSIDSDFQVGESLCKYDALGSGSDFALGSLHSTEGYIESPIVRIHMALQAATQFAIGVEPPFYILNTENNEVVTYDK
jgi:hypothetical protein